MTSPLISVLSPSSTGPMPGGAAAAGNPFQAEGPSFSSVLGSQQAQRQAASNAPAPKPAQSSSNSSGSHAASGAPAKPQQASSQQASQGAESQTTESQASGQAANQAGQHASADAAQGEATQAGHGQAEPGTQDTRVAGDEAATLHTLAGDAALATGVDIRHGNATVNAQGGASTTVAKVSLSGQRAQTGQPPANGMQGTALATSTNGNRYETPMLLAGQPSRDSQAAKNVASWQDSSPRAASAQAGADGRQAATELNSRVARTDAAELNVRVARTDDTEAASSDTNRPVARAAANDAGNVAAVGSALAGSPPQGTQPNSQATALRRAEPLTPARAAVLEGARRAVEAAQARAAQLEAGSTQGTDTAEFLDMLAYARSRSQPVAAAAGAASSGTEAASSTPAFMPTAPAMAAATPAATPVVATPLGSPYWGGEFGRQMVNMARTLEGGSQVIEMRLDPPDLGPIRISLSLSDNVAQAAFVSPHAVVRQTVENALPQLQQLLAEAGIALGDTSVSDQNQPGQQAGEGNGNGATGNSGGPGIGNTGSDATLVAGAAPTRAAANPDALVDTFA